MHPLADVYIRGQTEFMRMSDKVPITVLTGYLGAGKTTLLNRILSEPHGQKYAVIVNEFGEVGIDNDLIVGADEEIFEMNNGCVCCTVRGDLVRIIDGLMRRKGKFDAIILETTGLADPAPVAQTFFIDDNIGRKAKLDAVVRTRRRRRTRSRSPTSSCSIRPIWSRPTNSAKWRRASAASIPMPSCTRPSAVTLRCRRCSGVMHSISTAFWRSSRNFSMTLVTIITIMTTIITTRIVRVITTMAAA